MKENQILNKNRFEQQKSPQELTAHRVRQEDSMTLLSAELSCDTHGDPDVWTTTQLTHDTRPQLEESMDDCSHKELKDNATDNRSREERVDAVWPADEPFDNPSHIADQRPMENSSYEECVGAVLSTNAPSENPDDVTGQQPSTPPSSTTMLWHVSVILGLRLPNHCTLFRALSARRFAW